MAEPKILSKLRQKATLNSPAFTGTPTVPTAAEGTNTTQAASTAFVNNALSSYSSTDTKNTAGASNLTGTKLYVLGAASQDENPQTYSNSNIYISTNNVLMGAAWNDYAEFRSATAVEPGRCVCERGDGTLELSQERLQPAPALISDTFGFAIGETETCTVPIAVSGRVLAYLNPKEEVKAGDPVCAGPAGTVSVMTRDEVREYPDRIVGIVSEIPTYEEWNGVKVNGRIWIKI